MITLFRGLYQQIAPQLDSDELIDLKCSTEAKQRATRKVSHNWVLTAYEIYRL